MEESSHLYIKEIHVVKLIELIEPLILSITSTGTSPFLD
jgi:hypothetical protein